MSEKVGGPEREREGERERERERRGVNMSERERERQASDRTIEKIFERTHWPVLLTYL